MLGDAIKQIGQLPNWVQLWMRWLNIVFLFGLVFVGGHVQAQWAMAAYIVSFPVGFLAFYLVRDIRVTGLPQLLFWAPLVVYLIHAGVNDLEFKMMSSFGVWVGLLSVTICISVVLDIKGLVDVLIEHIKA